MNFCEYLEPSLIKWNIFLNKIFSKSDNSIMILTLSGHVMQRKIFHSHSTILFLIPHTQLAETIFSIIEEDRLFRLMPTSQHWYVSFRFSRLINFFPENFCLKLYFVNVSFTISLKAKYSYKIFVYLGIFEIKQKKSPELRCQCHLL